MNPFAELVRGVVGIDVHEPAPSELCRYCKQPYEAHREMHNPGETPPATGCSGLKSDFAEPVRRRFPCKGCGKDIGENYGLCPVCRKLDAKERVDAALKTARESIQEKFRGVRLDSPVLRSRVVGSADVIGAARVAIGGRIPVVLLRGPSLAGKTSLATAMLSEVIEAGAVPGCRREVFERARAARFFDATDLSLSRQEHRLGASVPEIILAAREASVLVIDEIGSDLARSVDVPRILHAREAAQRLTIVTTWLDQVGVKQAYGGGIASRLFKNSFRFELGGA